MILTAAACLMAVLLLPAAPGRGKAPAWELKDLAGKPVKSSDFKGKVVVLDFWATWCPPCRQEIPGFISLQKKYEKQNVVVIGISLDEEGPGVVKRFIDANHINYPVVMGDEKVATAFEINEGIPTTFVINPQGEIVSKHVGFTDESSFEKEIKPWLKSGSGTGGSAP